MSSGQGHKPTRVLCIQLKQLGDVLMTTPAVRTLATNLGDCEIDFLTQRPANTIYDNSPYVRHVYCVRWKARELWSLLLEVRRRKYDVLVDFSGSSKTAHFARLSGIPRRIGLAHRKHSWCFTDAMTMPEEIDYVAARKLSMLSVLDLQSADSSLDFFVPAAARQRFEARFEQWGIKHGPLFAVSPVSKRAFKVWPAERYAQICDRLVERYAGQIFFLIGPGEKQVAEQVRDHMKHESLPVFDDLDLYEAASLLDRAACYIGNDNGLMHLSVARKRPTFAVFGRHSPRNWAAPDPMHATIEYDPGCKADCFYPGCQMECINGIPVDAVWQRLTGFIHDFALDQDPSGS